MFRYILINFLADLLNKIDYSKEIADAKFAVEKFQGDKNQLEPLQSAIEGHLIALRYWECDMKEDFYADKCRDSVLKESVFAKYPDIKNKAMPLIEKGESINDKAMLRAIWQHTDKDIEKAAQLMK